MLSLSQHHKVNRVKNHDGSYFVGLGPLGYVGYPIVNYYNPAYNLVLCPHESEHRIVV